jgi:hypothetical protein
MSIAHYSRKPRNLLKFFHDGEKSLLKSLKETSVSLGCRVHRNSMVKSLQPCSFNSQAFSHPTLIKNKLKFGIHTYHLKECWVESRSVSEFSVFQLSENLLLAVILKLDLLIPREGEGFF